MMYLIKRAMVLVFVMFLFSCEGGDDSSSGIIESPVIDTTYTVNFSNNTTLGGNSKIILIFDRPQVSSRIFITGELSAESDGGVWSATTLVNGTLTISPATSWSAGSNKTLLIDVSDATNNIVQTISLNYSIDIIAPQMSNVLPVSTGGIGGSQQIVITFDKTMDISSLVLSGTMQAKSDAGVWSSTGANSNDKLTLTPVASWDAGAGQTLIIDVDETVGNSLTRVKLSDDVDLSSPTVTSINAENGTIILSAQAIVITPELYKVLNIKNLSMKIAARYAPKV